ncbi:MAG: hypothetical protein KBC02_02590 [Candidatus Pacebacteria bacterium]|nr:hypothetical protein [Candidatus Paceibacterota bacterium]
MLIPKVIQDFLGSIPADYETSYKLVALRPNEVLLGPVPQEVTQLLRAGDFEFTRFNAKRIAHNELHPEDESLVVESLDNKTACAEFAKEIERVDALLSDLKKLVTSILEEAYPGSKIASMAIRIEGVVQLPSDPLAGFIAALEASGIRVVTVPLNRN